MPKFAQRAACLRPIDRASRRIAEIVMAVGRVIDGIPPTPRRAALQTAQLRNKAIIVEQSNRTRIDRRQQISINVRLWPVRHIIGDALATETLAHPFTGIPITRY